MFDACLSQSVEDLFGCSDWCLRLEGPILLWRIPEAAPHVQPHEDRICCLRQGTRKKMWCPSLEKYTMVVNSSNTKALDKKFFLVFSLPCLRVWLLDFSALFSIWSAQEDPRGIDWVLPLQCEVWWVVQGVPVHTQTETEAMAVGIAGQICEDFSDSLGRSSKWESQRTHWKHTVI